MSKYLIVVDAQRDFVDGPLGTPEAVAIMPHLRARIQAAMADENTTLIFTRDTHYHDYLSTQEGRSLPVEHCIVSTSGWDFYDGVYVPGSEIVTKSTFGYPLWRNLFLEIAKFAPTEIELIGLCTDVCVISNALILKSLFPETKIVVDSAACAGTTPEAHTAALAVMRSCQIEIK